MRPRSRARRGSTDLRPSEVSRPKAPEETCGLCGRPIPPGARASRHHLVPKLKGGARLPTVLLHQVCHSAIHARFSEAELARRLCDLESLKAEPALARFIEWVRRKPDASYARTRRAAKLEADRARRNPRHA